MDSLVFTAAMMEVMEKYDLLFCTRNSKKARNVPTSRHSRLMSTKMQKAKNNLNLLQYDCFVEAVSPL